jgi:hypothetical protein
MLCHVIDHSTKLEVAWRKTERELEWPEYQDLPREDEPEVRSTKRRRLEEHEVVNPVLEQGNAPLAQGI